ncbi:beta-lactamase/transpeptidase-like protein [Auricularia subglabra TFB-10046 SS5]|uniref:Beta-lactamase/transpeptidase-like protein n=1 Tax=Auricularia subglabra (strain TFB-10046 / SS5) TaxID=717982 RepID=J0WVF1_AURST|nr:beta-lactamase/transpeptidase-like protein [Auricularia subglabra TFB-10046 SS5]
MTLAADIKTILEKAVTAPNGPAGLVYGAVDAKGNFLVCEAAGKRVLGKDEPMTTDSFFPLFSTTKLLATIGALQLVEQGKLSLDEPIHTVLPEILKVNYLKPDGTLVEPAPRAWTEKITLRILLSHTSGFGYGFFNSSLEKLWRQRGGPDELNGTREGTLDTPLTFEPGTRWQYGVGIDWAGEAIARVSGLGLGEYLKQNVFAPLGVADEITFRLTPAQAAKLVGHHQRGPDGVLRPAEHLGLVHNATFESAGAGALGTAGGYLTVLSALLNGGVGANGARILKEETVKSMFVNQVPDGVPGLGETIVPARPELTNPVPTPPGMRKGWGLSFELNLVNSLLLFVTGFLFHFAQDPLPTGRSANSGLWAGLANLYYTVDPTKGVATMILSQSFPFFDPAVLAPLLDAEQVIYASLT